MITSLHRRLAWRISLGALVIATIAGIASFFLEMEKVDDDIVGLADSQAKLFAAGLAGPVVAQDAPQMRIWLKLFLDGHKLDPRGHFVMAELYDSARNDVTQVEADLPPAAEKDIESDPHRFPSGLDPWYRKIVIDDRLFLQAVVPLLGDDKTPWGYFEGVYLIPAETMNTIFQGRVPTTVGLVVGAVLLTALLLYPIMLGLHREQTTLSRGLLKANLDTLALLGGAIAKRDSDTHAHNFRVTLYAVGLAEAIGLSAAAICELIKGAWLHDVGKIAISDTILLKPGKLDEAEFAVMKTHVGHGLDIVQHSTWLTGAAEVVAGHHEKFDGSGYPDGLVGEAIPLNARIFALADVFDALTSRRPYKEPRRADEALAMMAEGRGRHFDPRLFDVFAAIAPALHDQFGGREDDTAEKLLSSVEQRYYFREV